MTEETTEAPETPAAPTSPPNITYRLSTRLEERLVVGRDEAVGEAKSWSTESGQSVVVERVDGRVRMSFRDGGLVDYVYETRKGRSAS